MPDIKKTLQSSLKKNRIKIIAGLILGFLFIWLAFKNVNLERVIEVIHETNIFWLIIAFILSGTGYLIRAFRWQLILSNNNPVKYKNSFYAFTTGMMSNCILPVRLGEVIRVLVINQIEDISGGKAFASVVVERILDVFVLLTFFVVFQFFLPLPEIFTNISLTIFGISISIFLILILFYRKTYMFKGLLKLLPEILSKKISNFFYSFKKGLNIVDNGMMFTTIIFLSFIQWSYIATVNYVVFQAFNLGLPIFAAFLLITVVSLGISIPSTPGFIGTFHYFSVLALSIFGIEKNSALSFALIAHIIAFLPVILLGIFSFNKIDFSFRRLMK